MATFRGLSLDPITHDLHLDASSNLALVEDNAAIGQHVKERLIFYKGEWFLDTLAGTPWFQDVFVRPHNQVVIESVIKKEILETPGVAELTAFDLRIDERKRHIELLEAAARSTLDAELDLRIPISPVPVRPEPIVPTVPTEPPAETVTALLAFGLTMPNWTLPTPELTTFQPVALDPLPLVFPSGPVLPNPLLGQVAPDDRLFSNSTIPPLQSTDPAVGVTVGVNLYFTVPGEVRAVQFWRDASSSSSIAVGIWDSAGTLIGSKTLTKAPPAVDGWDSVTLDEPVPVNANTKYTVGWWQDDVAGTIYYAATEEGLASTIVSASGRIVAPADGSTVNGQSYINGCSDSTNALAFPGSTYNSRNYFVDVAFAPLAVERLLSDAITPAVTANLEVTTGVVLGVNLYFDIPGQIRAVRFWRSSVTSDNIAVGVWDSTGTLLESKTLTKAPPASDGWDSVTLDTPVLVDVDTKYTVGWWQEVNSTGRVWYAYISGSFGSDIASPNGYIIAPQNGATVNGQSYVNSAVWFDTSTMVYPSNSGSPRNYLVDLDFLYEDSGVAAVTLNPLFFSGGGSILEERPAGTWVGDLNGETNGSTITLIDDGGGRFSLSSLQIYTTSTLIDYETLPAGKTIPITIRETHPNAAAPRDTTLNIAVIDAEETDSGASAFLARIAAAGVTTTPEYQVAIDRFVKRLQRFGVYTKLTRIGIPMLAPSDAVALWDLKNATNNASVTGGTYTRSARGITWTGAGTQLVIPATPNAQNSQFIGVFLNQYTWASGRQILNSNNGQVQIVAPATTNTGNLSARLNGATSVAGTGSKHVSLWGLCFIDRAEAANVVFGINAGDQNEFVEALALASTAPAWTSISVDAEDSIVGGWAIGEHLTMAERAGLRYCFEALKHELDLQLGLVSDTGYATSGTFVEDSNPNSVIGSPGILRPTFFGYRPSVQAPGIGPTGAFINSNNQRFANFSTRNMGNGAIFMPIDLNLSGIVIEDIDSINDYRLIEMRNTTVRNFRISRCHVYGTERGLLRFGPSTGDDTGGSPGDPAIIEDCYCDAGGEYFWGDPFHALFDFARGHDFLVRRCTAKYAYTPLTSSFRQGDGFLVEGAVSNIHFESCLAEGNMDGGWDCKSNSASWHNCESRFNTRNYKIWGENVSSTGDMVTRSPRNIHISMTGGGRNPSITIERLFIESTHPDVPIFEYDFDVGPGTATINIGHWEFIGGMPPNQALIFYRGENPIIVNWGPQGRPPGGRDIFPP